MPLPMRIPRLVPLLLPDDVLMEVEHEHLSDAFGIMVKQYKLGLTATESDWLIGEGLLGLAVNGKAVRSMKAQGTGDSARSTPPPHFASTASRSRSAWKCEMRGS